MDLASSLMISSPVLPIITKGLFPVVPHRSTFNRRLTSTRLVSAAAAMAINQVSDPAQVQLTWQIVVGTLAGVTPFVVAGIEFTKRIVAQKKCGVCQGSGLVLRDNKYYFRCPNCAVVGQED